MLDNPSCSWRSGEAGVDGQRAGSAGRNLLPGWRMDLFEQAAMDLDVQAGAHGSRKFLFRFLPFRLNQTVTNELADFRQRPRASAAFLEQLDHVKSERRLNDRSHVSRPRQIAQRLNDARLKCSRAIR